MGVQGEFVISKYEASDGTFIYPIKLQPETLAASIGSVTNSAPTGAITAFLPSASVTKSKRGIGMHPRTVTLKVTSTGVLANNAKGTLIRLPILSKANFAAIKQGDTGTYQDDAILVVRKNPEVVV